MSALEKSVVAILGGLIIAALCWSAATLVDLRQDVAVLDNKVKALEGVGNVPQQLEAIRGDMNGVRSELARLRDDLKSNGRVR